MKTILKLLARMALVAYAVFMYGCAALTPSQIAAVNRFGRAESAFSAFPAKIMAGMAQIREARGVYYANTLTDPKLHLAELDSVHAQKVFDLSFADKVALTYKIIDAYGRALAQLSSDESEKRLKKHAGELGGDLDSLIVLYNRIPGVSVAPVNSLGSALAALVSAGGKRIVRAKQSAAVKEAVFRADTLVALMAANLLEYLQSGDMNALIKNEEQGLGADYLSFLRQTPRPSIENEKEYMRLKDAVDNIYALRQQCMAAAQAMRKAHSRLLDELKAKKNLAEDIVEVREFCKDVDDIQKALRRIGEAP